jgi:hypothetical protein
VVAWFAALFGWMLDAFDYTIFLYRPRFGVSLTAVAAVLSLTLWLRLLAQSPPAGSHRIGRKAAMLSILWFPAAVSSPGFAELHVLVRGPCAARHRHGAEWRRRKSRHGILARAHSRHDGGVLRARSPRLRARQRRLLGAVRRDGWAGLLWIGILPAFCVYIRFS